jgi:lantibiotic modifying enzyme
VPDGGGGRWRPILHGALRDRAEATIAAIAAALRDPGSKLLRGPWLSGGAVDAGLFFGYLARANDSDEYVEAAAAWMQRALEEIPTVARGSLFDGLGGVGWVLHHLAQPPVELDLEAEAACAAVDSAVLQELGWTPWRADYDLITGLVGFGVYLRSRLPRADAAAGLRTISAHLAALVERGESTATWLTPPELLPAHQREVAPQGYYNLGVAHGVPGVVALLADLDARGLLVAEAAGLLPGAVQWVLDQRLPPPGPLRLPAWVGPGQPLRPSRVAWCYGDLGAAVALLAAARVARRPDWEEAALDLARGAADCPLDQAGMADACLCHGAAGNGHLFNRLFQATGDPTFEAAALRYFTRALELRGPDGGVGGYHFWTGGRSGGPGQWNVSAGLLPGLLGVGLALLGATRELEPAWDEVLMARLPVLASEPLACAT